MIMNIKKILLTMGIMEQADYCIFRALNVIYLKIQNVDIWKCLYPFSI